MNHTADAPARLNANQITDDALDALYDERAELAAAVARIREWAESDVVTASTSFGDGYREALRDIRDMLPRPDGDEQPVHVAGPPDYCPACRLLPASQVPAILCPGPAKEQP